jgi:hypothetical protein
MPVLAAFGDTRLDADLAKILHGVKPPAQSPRAVSLMSSLQHLYTSRRASATAALALGLAIFAATAMLRERGEPHRQDSAKVAQPARHRVVPPAPSGVEQALAGQVGAGQVAGEATPSARQPSAPIAEAAAGPVLTTTARPPRKRDTKPTALAKTAVIPAPASAVERPSPVQDRPATSGTTDTVLAAVAPRPDPPEIFAEARETTRSDRRLRRDSVDTIRALRRQ